MSFVPRFSAVTIAGLAVAFLWLVLPETASAADVATFASFYQKSWMDSWASLAVGALAAIAVGGILFVTSGAVSPMVGSVGTWIGSLYGYSGAAATNFGLALLGAGAVASGGLGANGAPAMLNSVLGFSTDVVVDYSNPQLVERFRYARFVEQSRDMTTLPLPRNGKGPAPYDAAMDALAKAARGEPPSSPHNQQAIRAAIDALEASNARRPKSIEQRVRVASMLSLLTFLRNDYARSYEQADVAIRLARDENLPHTLPAFLRATASLAMPDVDPAKSLDDLRSAIRAEPDNAMIPVLVAVYLDRMLYRFHDGRFTARHLLGIRDIANDAKLAEHWTPVQVSLLSYHMIRLKAEQQRISSIAGSEADSASGRGSEGEAEKASPQDLATTATTLKRSIEEYRLLLEGCNRILGGLTTPAARHDAKAADEIDRMRATLGQYSADLPRLQAMADGFAARAEGSGVPTVTDASELEIPAA